MQCNVLLRVTGSSHAYLWVNIVTGADVQKLVIPNRWKEVSKTWREPNSNDCGHWVLDSGNLKVCFDDFVPCTPYFSRKLTLDRIYWMNPKEAYLIDTDEYEGNGRDYVTLAQLTVY